MTTITVQGLSRQLIEIRDRFECAKCGRRLHHENGAIMCDMPPAHGQHTIKDEGDIRRRRDVSPQTLEKWQKDEADRMLTQGGHAMPIKDRKRRSVGLSRAGMIRLGIKVPNIDKQTGEQKKDKWGRDSFYPRDVDYFVLKDAPGVASAYKDFKTVSDQYGKGPTELLIYLPFGDPLKNFDAWYELWKGKICHCRGDGEFVQRALDPNGVSYVVDEGWAIQDSVLPGFNFNSGQQVPCPGAGTDWRWQQCAKCNLSGVLRVLVRDPNEPTQLVADELRYYQIRTHSGVTYDRLSEQMNNYTKMAGQFGMALPGIPFRLLRVPETMSYVANGKRNTADHALMSLEPDEEWVRVITELSHKSALTIAAPTAAALPAGDSVDYVIEDEDTDDGYDHSWKEDGETGEVIVESEEPQPAPPQQQQGAVRHWIDRPDAHKRFWALAGELGLDKEQVYAALETDSVHEYSGTMAEAKVALEAYEPERRRPGNDVLDIAFGEEWKPLLAAFENYTDDTFETNLEFLGWSVVDAIRSAADKDLEPSDDVSADRAALVEYVAIQAQQEADKEAEV
jgi:hypothetical protein